MLSVFMQLSTCRDDLDKAEFPSYFLFQEPYRHVGLKPHSESRVWLKPFFDLYWKMSSGDAEIAVNIIFGICAIIMGIILIYQGRTIRTQRTCLCWLRDNKRYSRHVQYEYHIKWFSQDSVRPGKHHNPKYCSRHRTDTSTEDLESALKEIELGHDKTKSTISQQTMTISSTLWSHS